MKTFKEIDENSSQGLPKIQIGIGTQRQIEINQNGRNIINETYESGSKSLGGR